MINSLNDIIFNSKKIIIADYENKYPFYDVCIDIKTTLNQKFYFLEQISKENNKFINIIFHCKDNYLMEDFQIFIKKNINYLNKITFYFKDTENINFTIIKENIEKKKFKEVHGFLTPSLFFILDKSNDCKISNLIFCDYNKNLIQSYLEKFGLHFYLQFLRNFYKQQLELYISYETFFGESESQVYGNYIDYIFPNLDFLNILYNKNLIHSYLEKFGLNFYLQFLRNFYKQQFELYISYETFFGESESQVYGNYIDYIFPNLDYLNILDKQGYLYYSGGWSMTRPRQVLNLLNCLNINKNFFEGKTVLEVGPGLCDFLKVAKFCGSSSQTVIDKNPIFLMLANQIGVNETIQFDFQKENLESLFFSKTDILFIKGFLNVYYYEMDLIEDIVKKFTHNINQKGSGFWFTYNTYFDKISKNDYELRLKALIKLFENHGWAKISFNENQLRSSGLYYLENTDVLAFKIDKI